jgi:WD40 repeat protein
LDDLSGLGELRFRGLSFRADGQALAALLGDDERCYAVHWWDLRRDASAGAEDGGGHPNLDAWADPAVSPDHRLLARLGHEDTACVDYVVITDRASKKRPTGVTLVDPESGEAVGHVTRHREVGLGWGSEADTFTSLRFSPDNRWFAAAGHEEDESGIFCWDVGALLRQPASKTKMSLLRPKKSLPLEGEAVTCLAFSPDGRQLAAGHPDGAVSRWDFASGRPLPGVKGKKRGRVPVHRLAFGADGSTLAVAVGPAVTLFDTQAGASRATLGHEEAVLDLAFHPGGQVLATVCGDGVARFWDAAGEPSEQFDWEIGALSAVAFSPDGCTCAAGGEEGQVVRWDVGR